MLTNLTYLELSENQISSISQRTFSTLKKLTILKMNGNRLGDFTSSLQAIGQSLNLRLVTENISRCIDNSDYFILQRARLEVELNKRSAFAQHTAITSGSWIIKSESEFVDQYSKWSTSKLPIPSDTVVASQSNWRIAGSRVFGVRFIAGLRFGLQWYCCRVWCVPTTLRTAFSSRFNA